MEDEHGSVTGVPRAVESQGKDVIAEMRAVVVFGFSGECEDAMPATLGAIQIERPFEVFDREKRIALAIVKAKSLEKRNRQAKRLWLRQGVQTSGFLFFSHGPVYLRGLTSYVTGDQ